MGFCSLFNNLTVSMTVPSMLVFNRLTWRYLEFNFNRYVARMASVDISRKHSPQLCGQNIQVSESLQVVSENTDELGLYRTAMGNFIVNHKIPSRSLFAKLPMIKP